MKIVFSSGYIVIISTNVLEIICGGKYDESKNNFNQYSVIEFLSLYATFSLEIELTFLYHN